MKTTLTIALLSLCSIGMGQSKKTTILTAPDTGWFVKAASYADHMPPSQTTGSVIYNNFTESKPDTEKCYFLKVQVYVEFPLNPIGAEWYIGYVINYAPVFKPSNYLYINKQPVNEQVLLSMPFKQQQ